MRLGVVIAAAVFAAFAASAARAAVVLGADYEDGSVVSGVPGLAVVRPPAADAFQVTDAYARIGKRSLRTKITGSDDSISDGAHRAETNAIKVLAARYGEGDRFRYRFSLLVPTDWEDDTRDSIDIVFQFKRFSGGPDAFVAIKGKDVVLRCRERQVTLIKDYPKGVWLDFRLAARWSSGGDGSIEAAAGPAGTEPSVAVDRGANLPAGAKPASGYLKWGLYKRDYARTKTKRPRVAYHDAIVVERLD